MLLEENKNITLEFKEKLLKATKRDVYGLIDKTDLSEHERFLIDMFYVKPLFWSRLNFFIGTMNVHNDVAIDEVLQDDKLTEDEQKAFLSLLAQKLDITTTDNTEVDATNINNKLFYSSDFVVPEIDKIKQLDIVDSVEINGKTVTNCRDYFNIENNFIGAVIEEQLRTKIPILKILNSPVTSNTVSAYKNIDTNSFNNNEVKIVLKNKLKKEELKVNVLEGKTFTYNYNKTIIDIELVDIEADSISIDYEENNVGFFKRNVEFSFLGPINGSIKISYVDDVAPDVLLDIYKTTNGYKTVIENKKLCKVNFFLKEQNKNDIDFVYNAFKGVENYSDFVNVFRQKVYPYLFKKNNILTNMYADIYLSPFIYKRVLFGFDGIIMYNSKLLSLISKNELVMSVKTVEKDTQNNNCMIGV